MAGHMGKHSVLSMSVATNHLFTTNQSVSACVDLTRKEIETCNGFESVVARTQIVKALCSQKKQSLSSIKLQLQYFLN